MPLCLRFLWVQRVHSLHDIFLIGLLNLSRRLLTLANLAESCWRTGDDERAQCMEKGPCGGFPAPILPQPSNTTTYTLLDLCLLISVTMVKHTTGIRVLSMQR